MAREQDKEPVFVPLYFSYLQTFEPLSDDQLGRVVRAVLKKYTTGEITDLEPIEQLVMNVMSRDVDKALVHYNEVAEERRKAAQARWEKAKQKNANDANAFFADANGCKTMQSDANDAIEKEKEKEKEKENNNRVEDAAQAAPTTSKRKRNPPFRPPTVDEVRAYCAENGYDIDAEYFVDYYAQRGWMSGRYKMKDWQATVRNWSRRDKEGGTVSGGYAQKPKRDPMLEYLDNRLKEEMESDNSGDNGDPQGVAGLLSGLLF